MDLKEWRDSQEEKLDKLEGQLSEVQEELEEHWAILCAIAAKLGVDLSMLKKPANQPPLSGEDMNMGKRIGFSWEEIEVLTFSIERTLLSAEGRDQLNREGLLLTAGRILDRLRTMKERATT